MAYHPGAQLERRAWAKLKISFRKLSASERRYLKAQLSAK